MSSSLPHALVTGASSGIGADIAREYGAQIIVLTSNNSPLASKANIVLPVVTEETDFIYKPSASRYGMLLAIDILATELALARKNESKELQFVIAAVATAMMALSQEMIAPGGGM